MYQLRKPAERCYQVMWTIGTIISNANRTQSLHIPLTLLWIFAGTFQTSFFCRSGNMSAMLLSYTSSSTTLATNLGQSLTQIPKEVLTLPQLQSMAHPLTREIYQCCWVVGSYDGKSSYNHRIGGEGRRVLSREILRNGILITLVSPRSY